MLKTSYREHGSLVAIPALILEYKKSGVIQADGRQFYPLVNYFQRRSSDVQAARTLKAFSPCL